MPIFRFILKRDPPPSRAASGRAAQTHLPPPQLADCLQPQRFQAGEYLLRCDDPPQCMFIIVEGTVKVVGRDPDGNNVDVCDALRPSEVGWRVLQWNKPMGFRV